MRQFYSAACLVLGLWFAVPAQAQNLIQNGGFETGDFTNWTTANLTSFSGVDGAFPHTGAFAAFFGEPGPTLGTIEQSVTTSEGVNYLLTFWVHSGDNGPNQIQVQLNSNVVFNQNDRPDDGGSYAQISIPFVATGSSTAVSLGFFDVPSFIDLDDVSVIGVPEPTTWALMSISGAAVVGGAWWRKRRSRLKVRGWQASKA